MCWNDVEIQSEDTKLGPDSVSAALAECGANVFKKKKIGPKPGGLKFYKCEFRGNGGPDA